MGGMEMSVCEKGYGAGSVANWQAESFFHKYCNSSCNLPLEKWNDWKTDEGEEVTVHIKDAAATEVSKHCAMKVYGQKFWLVKLEKVPFCYSQSFMLSANCS